MDDEKLPVDGSKIKCLKRRTKQKTKSNVLRELRALEAKQIIRAKTILENIKSSKMFFSRANINHDNEIIYVDETSRGLKAAVFLYEKKNKRKTSQFVVHFLF